MRTHKKREMTMRRLLTTADIGKLVRKERRRQGATQAERDIVQKLERGGTPQNGAVQHLVRVDLALLANLVEEYLRGDFAFFMGRLHYN